MKPANHFHHCPKCGASASPPKAGTPFACGACGFVYFFNPAIATAAIVRRDDGRILLLRRARDPQRGKLTLPGGFMDYAETGEESVAREVREETGLTVTALEYFCSLTNEYPYKGVTYPVLDFFYVARVESFHVVADPSEVEAVCWLAPDEIDPGEIAFASVREALRRFTSSL
ncbi:MAG: NUDIX domain-containing protein [Verrucomicrobia bacterium]|nr:NUDIX domain-containing protein [Verrucomicrobiota bacterium]